MSIGPIRHMAMMSFVTPELYLAKLLFQPVFVVSFKLQFVQRMSHFCSVSSSVCMPEMREHTRPHLHTSQTSYPVKASFCFMNFNQFPIWGQPTGVSGESSPGRFGEQVAFYVVLSLSLVLWTRHDADVDRVFKFCHMSTLCTIQCTGWKLCP